MIFVKQSTAVGVVIGPFVDDTDGKTAETALTLSQADCLLMKNAGAAAQKNDATSATHLAIGHYKVPLNTTDTATLGVMRLSIHETGALPCFLDLMVMPANVWDSMFGADFLQVDAAQWLGTTIAAPDTAGYPKTTVKSGTGTGEVSLSSGLVTLAGVTHTGAVIPTVTTTGTATNVTTVNGLAADVITSSALAASAVTEIQSGLSTSAALSTAQTSLTTIEGYLDTEVAAILAAVDTEVAAIKAKTDNLPTDPADASDIAASFSTVNSTLSTIAAYIDTEIAAILAAVDTEIAAIKAKTDNLPAAPAATGDIPTTANILASGDVDGYSIEQTLKLLLAEAAGKLSGAATTTNTFRAADDSTARITATVDEDGNRTAITLDATG